VIEALPKLEIIACQGVGVDAIDVAAAKGRGVAVTNTPDVLTTDVADLAIGLILAAARRIVKADRFVRDGQWLREIWPLGRRATGKTLGIVGLGRIGKAIAARAAGFGMQILYTGPKQKADVPYEYVRSLVALAERSDFLVLACPGGPATQNLVSDRILEALGPEGTLINVARGSVVDEAALIEALGSGRLGFAALDAFADEPRAPEALFKMPNVILQPHQGSATFETRDDMGRLVLENLVAKFEKRPLPTPVSA
jgi:lactate dehydrogenase-like 2-hydroxyacid dehydrogenase